MSATIASSSIDQAQWRTTAEFKDLLQQHPETTELRIIDPKLLDVGFIRVIANSLPQLRSLRLGEDNCGAFDFIHDDEFTYLAEKCTQLEHIELVGFSHVTEAGLLALFGANTSVSQVNLHGPAVTDAVITQIATKSLTSLTLFGECKLSDTALKALEEHSPHLEELKIEMLPSDAFSQQAVESALKSLKHLRIVHISGVQGDVQGLASRLQAAGVEAELTIKPKFSIFDLI